MRGAALRPSVERGHSARDGDVMTQLTNERRVGSETLPCVVELRDLTKSFGDVRAVDAVSAVALPGEVTALLGPNGAGKTTTLRMLLGLAAPSSGTATFGGR